MRPCQMKDNKKFARAGGMHHRRTARLLQQPLSCLTCSLIVGKSSVPIASIEPRTVLASHSPFAK